jgi:hypothetical protein
MDLQPITMDRYKARELFLEYRRAVKARHTDEDKQIMEGYRYLAKGIKVLNIIDALRQGGVDRQKLPRLAICRANAEYCYFKRAHWNTDTHVLAATCDAIHAQHYTRQRVTMPASLFPTAASDHSLRTEAQALVPIIPPQFRPADNLFNYHILWEADWEVAPVDPVLLKHIAGPLYAILAQWDLTDLERAVIEGRLR